MVSEAGLFPMYNGIGPGILACVVALGRFFLYPAVGSTTITTTGTSNTTQHDLALYEL